MIANILILIVAIEHVFICIFEMFFSKTKAAEKAFGLNPSFMQNPEYQIMMANQGLYNLFLAAGLIWAVFFVPESFSTNVKLFFLTCVLVAGIYGGLTAKKSIIFTQGLPALISILAIYFI